jgi:hypothetical protein
MPGALEAQRTCGRTTRRARNLGEDNQSWREKVGGAKKEEAKGGMVKVGRAQ